MNEVARQALQARLEEDKSQRERLRGKLRAAHDEYERLRGEFEGVQARIDAIRDELGFGSEDRELVTPPELEAVA